MRNRRGERPENGVTQTAVPEAEAILLDEDTHEMVLLRRTPALYRSIVLGLNDALVELTVRLQA